MYVTVVAMRAGGRYGRLAAQWPVHGARPARPGPVN